MKIKTSILLSFIFILALKCNTVCAQWNSFIYLSTDMGNWNYGSLSNVDFISPDSGFYSYYRYVSPSSGYIKASRTTKDAGVTWSNPSSYFTPNGNSTALKVARKQRTYYSIPIYGGFGDFMKSSDNANTWQFIQSINCGSWTDMYAIDTSHIFLLKNKQFCPILGNQYIDKYENGIYYSMIDSITNVFPRLIFFPDTTTGYIAASNSSSSINNTTILKSISSGTNWFTVYNDSSMNIKSIFFLTDSLGYAVGDFGEIIKTSDGGSIWQSLNSGITTSLYSVYFINDSVGFAAGEAGKIIRTKDAGATWTQDSTGTSSSFNNIFFMNDSIGYAISYQLRSVYKTNLNNLTAIWELANDKSNSIVFYPNPTEGNINIEGIHNEIIIIYNSIGMKIKEYKAENKIDISEFPEGHYIIQVLENSGRIIHTEQISLLK